MNLFLETKISVPELFFPADINRQEYVESEEKMVICANFFLRIIRNSCIAISKNQFIKFDANAADFGCEKQALILLNLFNSNVKQESEELSEIEKKISNELTNRKNTEEKNRPEEFFQEKIEGIKISEGMAYVLRAFMLTVTKKVTKEGNFQTEICQLDSIYKGFTGPLRNKIIFFAQEKLSESSVGSIKNEISEISTLLFEEIKVLQEIFESSILKSSSDFKIREEKYKSVKYFSPSFHTIKSVFARLSEIRVPIMITSLTHKKEKKEFLNLFFQSDVQIVKNPL
jgi:hypothetical protein